jgi:hypothetical protein
MEEENNGLLFPLNTISKVFVILESIKESKYNYIEVVNPVTDQVIMKIKLNLEGKDYVGFLDTFFDNGFKIRGIEKSDFDSLESDDVMNFNL